MAVRPATVPASTNDRITAGPATGTACVSTMKMPVPIVAPTPNSVSWNNPMERLSSPRVEAVPASAAEQPGGRARLGEWMRILITSNRGPGHIEPLVPFAHALRRAGDDVL